jgi:hypothetical protein
LTDGAFGEEQAKTIDRGHRLACWVTRYERSDVVDDASVALILTAASTGCVGLDHRSAGMTISFRKPNFVL